MQMTAGSHRLIPVALAVFVLVAAGAAAAAERSPLIDAAKNADAQAVRALRPEESGRQRRRSRRHDRSSLGQLPGRPGERRPADSRRRQGECRQRSGRHAALDRQPERKRGDGPTTAAGGRRSEPGAPARRDARHGRRPLGQPGRGRTAAGQGRQRRTRAARAARPRSCGPWPRSTPTSSRCCSHAAPTSMPAPTSGAR